MGWVHPWVGFGWVGSGRVGSIVQKCTMDFCANCKSVPKRVGWGQWMEFFLMGRVGLGQWIWTHAQLWFQANNAVIDKTAPAASKSRGVYPPNNHGALPPNSHIYPFISATPSRKQFLDIVYAILCNLCVFSVNFGSCQSGIIMIPKNINGVGKAHCMFSFLSEG